MPPVSQPCPICAQPVRANPRYPRCVCSQCARKAASRDGRPLSFSNEGLAGGFVAKYADTGEKYLGHDCYIDGVKCRADEARFGAIVIQAAAFHFRPGPV